MEDTLRVRLLPTQRKLLSLNPCFNGRYSQSGNKLNKLVGVSGVLILVLMEDTLRENRYGINKEFRLCLNPCFNGRYSQSTRNTAKCRYTMVLILVLMEDTLRVIESLIKASAKSS